MSGPIDRWTTAVKSEGIVIDRLQLAELSSKGIIQAHEDGLNTIVEISSVNQKANTIVSQAVAGSTSSSLG
jgi:hypothetical protein